MRRLLCLMLLAVSVTVSAQPLADADVNTALANAKRFKLLHLSEIVFFYVYGHSVDVYSPTAWIQAQAAKAQQERRPFGLADVTEDDRADVWRVVAYPSMPREVRYHGVSVSHVVLRSEDQAVVLQPLTKEPFDVTAGNTFGATVTHTGLRLTFDGADVRELWGAKQDQEFVVDVISQSGTATPFVVQKKHFKQLTGER